MREFFLKIFSEKAANEFTKISLFSPLHFAYLAVIVLIISLFVFLYFKKEIEKKEKIVNIFAILVLLCYLLDFFFQPFFNGGTMDENGELILDKFPFHICTVLCPLIMFSRYSKYKNVIKTPIAVLSIVAPLMWLVYPGSALDTDCSAFSYEIVQLFMYHGLVFAYGILSLCLEDYKLDIKKCYKEAIFVVGITLWAAFGNAIYSSSNHDYNWLFIKDPVFDFVPENLNPYTVMLAIYLSCLVIYGIYYLVVYLYKKKSKKEVTM